MELRRQLATLRRTTTRLTIGDLRLRKRRRRRRRRKLRELELKPRGRRRLEQRQVRSLLVADLLVLPKSQLLSYWRLSKSKSKSKFKSTPESETESIVCQARRCSFLKCNLNKLS